MMKNFRYFLLLVCLGCSSAHPLNGTNVGITATITAIGPLHRFHDATAMSVDQFRNAYVVESSNNSVIKISPNGDSLRSLSGSGDDHYQFNGPSGIDAHLTNAIFISDRYNHRIEQYNKDFTYTGTLYTREYLDKSTRFGYPAAVAVDDAGNIYVADGENKRVVKARSDYSIERTIGGFSDATRPDAILSNPVGLAIDKEQHLIVLDNGGMSLVEYDNLGNFLVRTQLGEKACYICSYDDEIYALIPDRSIVRMFHSVTLSEEPSLEIRKRIDSTDTFSLVAFLVGDGGAFVLTRQALYETAWGSPGF